MSGLITPINIWWSESKALDIHGKITFHYTFHLPIGYWMKICAWPNRNYICTRLPDQ